MDCMMKSHLADEYRPMPYSAFFILGVGALSEEFVKESDGNRGFIAVVLEVVGLLSLPCIIVELFLRSVISACILAVESCIYYLAGRIVDFQKKLPSFGKHLGETVRNGFLAGFLSCFGVIN